MKDLLWIFFDLGSTLIDETDADLRRIREMTAGTAFTAEAYCAKRLEMIRQDCRAIRRPSLISV